MSQAVENKQYDDEALIRFFRFNASEGGSKLSSTYSKSVNSLVSFLRGQSASMFPNPETAVCDWIVHINMCGLSLNTALPYLNSIAALYNKAVTEGLAPPSDVFSVLKARLKEGSAELWNSWISPEEFNRFRDMMKSGQFFSEAQRLLFYSITKGCLPLAEATKTGISDVSDHELEMLGIDKSAFTGNRKYIFPFGQSALTPAQLAKRVACSVFELFAKRGLHHCGSVDDTLRSYWAYAALRIGVAPHAVRSFFPAVPSGLPILSLCRKECPEEADRQQIIERVAEVFTDNPLRWYVMRLRPRVTFDDLEKTFIRLGSEVRKPELFYPCQEIMRRIGKKMSVEQKPIIPDIVFFKCRETEVYPLFMKIGDLAWCYRVNGRTGGAYAPVSKKAFEAFQSTIGQFTPDYEVAPAGQLTPRIGDEVVVVGGSFQSLTGTLRKIEDNNADSNIIYRIEIVPEGGGATWSIGIDARMVRNKKSVQSCVQS